MYINGQVVSVKATGYLIWKGKKKRAELVKVFSIPIAFILSKHQDKAK